MRDIRLHEVEIGRSYRFTFSRPVVEGSRKRSFEAVVGAAFWGEVPFHTADGIVRVERDLITRVRLAS
jgi:hypothetical protein